MVIDLPHLAEAARFSLRWGDEPLLDWAGTRRSVQVSPNTIVSSIHTMLG